MAMKEEYFEGEDPEAVGTFTQGEADFPAPPPVSGNPEVDGTRKRKLIKYGLIGGIVLLFVIILAATLGGGGGGGGGGEGSNVQGAAPTPSGGQPQPPQPTAPKQGNIPTAPPTMGPTSDLFITISSRIGNSEREWLQQEGSFQYRAMRWLESSANPNYSETQLLQRYVLAVLYYSTNGIPSAYTDGNFLWKNTDGWLTQDDECNWFGVVCDPDTKIVEEISLKDNQLSGKLPRELQHLSNMKVLEVSNNAISMMGGQTQNFGFWRSLMVFSIEDNYIDYVGIPISMAKLTNLVAVEIGLNLLSGPMDATVFSDMQDLVYFDAHSNYLTGDIPTTVHKLDSIEQLRFQYNAMTHDLSFIRSGKLLSNLRVLWLDENTINGFLPKRLGEFYSLESLSFAGTGIHGQIPTELGNAGNLSEVWLHNNKLSGNIPTELGLLKNLTFLELHNNSLTGLMPAQICALSPSEALTADCNGTNPEVICNCCSKCYAQ